MSKNEKDTEKLQKWYDDNVVEDIKECNEIGELAKRECLNRWNVGFEYPETVLGFYSIVYQTILDKLCEKRSDKNAFAIKIADIVEIGYDNDSDDGEQEKSGNFCPYICDLGGKTESNEDPDLTTIERCTEWCSTKLNDGQKSLLNDIAKSALKNLKDDVDIHISASTAIFPIFSTIHEQIVSFMRVRQAETGDSEVMINFCNNFDIYCRIVEGGEAVIEYSPKPYHKISIKSDITATAPQE